MSIPVVYVTSAKQAREVMREIMQGGKPRKAWRVSALDTEFSDNEDGSHVDLYFMQICNGKVRICIDGKPVSKLQGLDEDCIEEFRAYIESAECRKVYSEMEADVTVLEENGFTPRGFHGDTQVMDWLNDENRWQHGLKACARDHCQFYMRDYRDVFGYHELKKDGTPKKKREVASMREAVEGKEKHPYLPWTSAEGIEKARKYAALDPLGTWLVYKFLRKELEEKKLWKLYTTLERPFGEVLMHMERRGIAINRVELKRIDKLLMMDMLRLTHVFRYRAVKEGYLRKRDADSLNLKSDQQMKDFFWNKLKLPKTVFAPQDKKKEKGQLNAEQLGIYAEANVSYAKWLLSFRQCKTLRGTFVKGMLTKCHPLTGMAYLFPKKHRALLRQLGLVITRFKHTGTITGRISSGGGQQDPGKPNLQNIPSRPEKDPYQLRRFFVPLPGYKFIVADYSQIELYIIAQLSRDPRMIQAFQRGEDLHMITAAGIYNLKLPKPPKKWDKNHPDYARWKKECDAWKVKYESQRGDGKIMNFATNYGASAYKLQFMLDCELKEAEKRLALHFKTYPGLKKWIRKTIKFCEEHGYVETPTGHRRNLPEIFESPFTKMGRKLRGHAERQAMNAPIQGFAAEIIKMAMILLHRDPVLKKLGLQMLVQVHDELVMMVPEENAEKALPRVIEIMVSPYKKEVFKDISIKVEAHIGDNWAEAKKGKKPEEKKDEPKEQRRKAA